MMGSEFQIVNLRYEISNPIFQFSIIPQIL